MSEKNRDNKNRWRNVTIAFRMSPEENEELDLRVKLCGYQTRQEYIIESVLHQKVTAVGNPLMLVLFGKLNAASSVRLKQVFQSVIQWYEAHSFGHFRQAILCGKTIMQIILHDGF